MHSHACLKYYFRAENLNKAKIKYCLTRNPYFRSRSHRNSFQIFIPRFYSITKILHLLRFCALKFNFTRQIKKLLNLIENFNYNFKMFEKSFIIKSCNFKIQSSRLLFWNWNQRNILSKAPVNSSFAKFCLLFQYNFSPLSSKGKLLLRLQSQNSVLISA